MRNRDSRGRFRRNIEPQKEETSPQKEKEIETEILVEETIEQNLEPGNTIHQQTQNLGDPALDDTVDPEKIQALLRNPELYSFTDNNYNCGIKSHRILKRTNKR
jgi:hypothetical protein